MVKFRQLFHGTSSLYKAAIQENGLLPRDGPIYLSTQPKVALLEADRTVRGEDNLRDGYKKGVGGAPLLVAVDRSAATGLKLDVAGYYERGTPFRPSEVRFAFMTSQPISAASISFIENDQRNVCNRLLEEIEEMTRRRTFDNAIGVDFKNRIVVRLGY
jgi:hypothetical protein